MKDENLTEQEKLEKRRIHPVNKLAFRALTLVTGLLYYRKLGVSFRYNTDISKYRNKPYVVVANHASRLDHVFTGLAFFPDTFNYVVGYNEFFRSHLAAVMRIMQVIPKKNFTPQPYAIKQMMRVIREGGRIIIMPEGMSSISGASQPCALGGGQLLKGLGVPVLCCKISGGYLTSTKYCLDERPGKVDVCVDLLYSPEDLKRMSADEIQHDLNAKLWHDDYEWNKKARAGYKGRGRMAENLHQLLFWCPKCGAELQMSGRGNTIRCNACGNEAELNEKYELIPRDGDCVIPDTPRVWFDMQREHIRKLVAEDSFSLTEHIKLGTLPEHGFLKNQATSEIVGEGELTLDREGLHYEGTRNGKPFEFFVPSLSLPTYGMCTDVSRFYTYVGGEFMEFYPERDSAELWFMATEEMHRLNGGAWQDYSEDEIKKRPEI